MTDGSFLTASIKHTRELDDGCRATLAERSQHVKGESKVGGAIGSKNARASIAVVVDKQRVLASFPRDAVRGIGDDGIKRLIVSVQGIQQRVA